MNKEIQSFSATEYLEKADSLIAKVMFGYFMIGFGLAFFYDTYMIAIGVGGLNLLLYFLSKLFFPHGEVHRYLSGLVFGIFMAQFIYQMHGMFEMHFWAFIASILLINHQNWKLQIPLAVFVLVHHSLFAYLQYAGNSEIYFTQQDYMPLDSFIFHGSLATLIFSICGYWAYLNEQKSRQMMNAQEILLKQFETVKRNIDFADEIAKGNLYNEYVAEADDDLGNALVRMRSNLVNAAKREEQEKFINIGLANSSDILRRNNETLSELSDDILRFVVKYLNVNQGSLFLVTENESGDSVLELEACYAYDRKKYIHKTILLGEGLVGQAYLERAYIYLTEVPNDYINITSGLGGANPSCILIVPLIFNEEVFGVIELASFSQLEKHKIDFVVKLAENIASTISITRVNERTKKLLDETRIQAEMLKAQEEEMRQNMEELQATQEEMERKYRNSNT